MEDGDEFGTAMAKNIEFMFAPNKIKQLAMDLIAQRPKTITTHRPNNYHLQSRQQPRQG